MRWRPAGRRAAAPVAVLVTLLIRTVAAQSHGYDYDILGFQDASDLDTGQVTQVTAVTGGSAELPCSVDPDTSRDIMRLVLWYKDSTGAPFYSYDTRGRQSSRGTHWANEDSLGRRSSFEPHPMTPLLRIQDVQEEDQGVYRCRADFKASPTLNARVNLTVIVPPEQPVVYNASGHMVREVAGPYKMGDTARLTCEVKGGRPPPNVTWWLHEALVDDSWHQERGVTRNTLQVASLQRADLANQYTCMAGNTALRPHLSTAVRLDISFPPVEVRITNDKQASVSANKRLELSCRAVGSRPRAEVVWSRNGAVLSGAVTRSQGDNVTISTLRLLPSAADSGQVIRCRAFSPAVPDTVLEDFYTLRVNYRPVVGLTVGHTLKLSDIEEGDDVYFECHIRAVPWVHSHEFRLNGKPLVHSKTDKIIMINQSLALQDLTRERSGTYTCAASNDEGEGVSEGVYLPVKYAPRCDTGQKQIYGAAKFEEVLVHCRVEASPGDVTFRWSFNNTGEVTHLPTEQFTVNGTESVARYSARSELDYGTLLCWARNAIGWQKTPCVFHIVSAGVPEPPTNCSSHNSSSGSLTVQCLAGNDGGLPQLFVLQVRGPGGQLHYNTTAQQTPRFSVRGLQPNTFYQILIYARNAKGRSKPLVMETETLRDAAERRTEKIIDGSLKESFDGMLTVTPVLMVLIVAVGGLLIIIIIVVVLLRMRGRPTSRRRGTPPLTGLQMKEMGHQAEGDSKNPDLIQTHGEHGFPMIEATCSAEGGPERCGSGRAPSQRGRSGSGPDPGRPGDISYIPAAAYVGSVSSSTLPRSTHCPQHPYGSDEAVQYAQLSLPRGRSSRTGGPSPVTYAQLEHQHHHNHLPPVPPVPPPAGWAQGGRQWADAAPPGHESSGSPRSGDGRPSGSSSTSAETVVPAT